MDSLRDVWRHFFVNWPKDMERRGVVVTSFSEQILFESFFLQEETVLLNRRAPDSVGARREVIPYGKIEAVKIVDPVQNEVFESAGFRSLA